MGHLVGNGKHAEHEGQGAGIVQVLGNPVLAKHQAIQVTGSRTDQETHQQGFAENIQGVAEDIALAPGHNPFEHQYRQQGADRVNDNAFPGQDIGQFGSGPHCP